MAYVNVKSLRLIDEMTGVGRETDMPAAELLKAIMRQMVWKKWHNEIEGEASSSS